MSERPLCKFEGCDRGRCLHGKDPVTGRQYYKPYCGIHSGRARRGGDMADPYKGKDTIENRLMRYVTPGSEDECWEWEGGRDAKGYGLLGLERTGRRAHRLMYEVHKGPIPDGLLVRHTCDNPPCVNPAHLLVGDHHDNAVDMVQRFRQANQKLTAEDVAEMRRKRAEYGTSTAELAERYSVSRDYVNAVLRGAAWSHSLDLVEREP